MDQLSQILNRYPHLGQILDRAFDAAIHIAILILAVILCSKLIRVLSVKIQGFVVNRKAKDLHSREREKRISTVVQLVQTTLNVILYITVLLMVLKECGLDITPLLTGAGIAGVAVGFGAQSLVKDVISGFFLLVEDQIRIGDVVKIAGLGGTVERMELRITAIRDGDGTLHIVPNSEIKTVSNMTYDFATAVVNLFVPYQVSLKTIVSILEKVSQDFQQDPKWQPFLRGNVNIVGVTEFAGTGVTVQLTVKTDAHSRWTVLGELRNRVKYALDEAKVDLNPITPTAK